MTHETKVKGIFLVVFSVVLLVLALTGHFPVLDPTPGL